MNNQNFILIKGKPFYYEAQKLILNEVPTITFEQARDILFFAKELLDEKNIEFNLIYGTLLGAIRERSFISHDYDVDIFIKDQEALMNAIPEFYKKGFKLCRVEENRLYSFMVNGVYIDIYIMKKAPFFFNWWCYSLNGNIIPKKYLKESEKIEFVGAMFNVPKDPIRLIKFFYGKNWKTPIKGAHGRYSIYPVHFYRKFKKYLFTLIKRQ